jgi:hypothetical protein
MTYKLHAQPVAGESYVRCNQVIIENPAASPPTILFSRERVIGVDGGEVIRQPLQPVPLAFDPLGEIPLVDMETGEPTGQVIRQVEVYAAIFSAFLAAERPPAQPETLNEGETP